MEVSCQLRLSSFAVKGEMLPIDFSSPSIELSEVSQVFI